jgi:hypothetical protein
MIGSRRLPALAVFVAIVLLPGPAPAGDPDPDRDGDAALLEKMGIERTQLADLVRKRILSEEKRTEIQDLIRRLGDDDYETREKASKALVEQGAVARPQLLEALKAKDLEVRRRAERVLAHIPQEEDNRLMAAVIRRLGRAHAPETVSLLFDYLPSIEDPEGVDVVGQVLRQVGLKDGKPDPLVLRAVADRNPRKRAVAGEVLCRAGKEHRTALRKLLRDPELSVRKRVAFSLLEARDKEGVAALISLLTEVPRDERYAIEERLFLVAGEKAPADPGRDEDPLSRKYQMAWQRWWRDAEPALDLSKIDLTPRFLNYTLVCLMDKGALGKVAEFDAAGRQRWAIDGLQMPLCATVVGPDRVLICELRNGVSERNFKGEVLWQRNIAAVVADRVAGVHRLPNGHTFIFTRSRIEEVDRNGKEIFTLHRDNSILAGQADPAGHLHLLTAGNQYQRIDRTGRVLKTFAIGSFTTLYNSFQVLPNGHLLVPHYILNKVCEYNEDGKVVWETAAIRPTTVQRLPNGNTLIGSRLGRRIVELDARGKEVWGRDCEGQVLFVQRR